MSDPTTVLVPPSDAPVIPDLVNNMLGFSQYISPSYWVNQCIAMASGFNVLETVTKTVAGDWNAVSQAGRALELLGSYHNELAAELRVATTKVGADWEGGAADAASGYFTDLADALDDQATQMKNAGNQYLSVSAGMEQSAVAIDSLLRSAMDWLIIAAASAAATAAASWTGVGLLVGGTATVASIARAATLLKQVKDAHDLAVLMANGATGLIAGYLGAIKGFESTALPSSYDNTLVP